MNAIAPGFFISHQNHDLLLDKDDKLTQRGQTIIDHTPSGCFGRPDDLIGTLVWLCSPGASFVNGVVVRWTAASVPSAGCEANPQREARAIIPRTVRGWPRDDRTGVRSPDHERGERSGAVGVAFAPLPLDARWVLVIIPHSSRAAPVPLLSRLLHEEIGRRVMRLDYLIALGAHAPMPKG